MMKALITTLLCALALSTAAAQTPEAPGLEWAKSYAANRRVGEGRNSSLLAVDGNGNVFIIGAFSGTVDFDPGPGLEERTSAGAFDAFLLKLDAAGNFQWVYQIGGSGPEQAGGVAVDGSGHVYITGSFNGTVDFDPGAGSDFRTARGNSYLTTIGPSRYSQDTYICKLTTNGEPVWVRTIDGSDGGVLALDSFANLHILGSYGSTPQSPTDFDPGAGSHPLSYPDSICCGSYLLKLDSAGTFRWALHLGVGRSHRHMTADPAGNIYITGDFHSTARPDFDPGPNDSIGVNGAPFILKLDNTGAFRWGRQVIPAASSALDFFQVTLGGTHLFATGYFRNTVDFNPGPAVANLTSVGSFDAFMLSLDTAGNYAGAARMGGNGTDIGTSIALDAGGNMYIGGVFEDTVDVDPGPGVTNLISKGGDDGFVIKLAPAGNLLWAWGAGARNDRDTLEDHDIIYGLALGPQGHLHVDGMFNDTVDFDPCPGTMNLIATRAQESFLVKLNQEGCEVTIVPVLPDIRFSLVPNPATQSVILTSSRNLQGNTIRLVNLMGQVVEEWKDIHSTSFVIELKGRAAGTYFVEIVKGDEVQRLRLVVR